MRTRYWQVIHVATIIFLTYIASCLGAEDIIKKLPFCNPHTQEDSHLNDLVIVSTLDGRISAFATENGKKAWDFETEPLLSSNLHHVELTSGGKWVRLVPSLRGTLYSLSGDSIEPLPFDAEQLLTSSFKYSDELVIAGARETRWVGVDARTGLVVYECNSSGCNSEQQTASAGRDILVLRRHSNTVRALDPRSGTEKWNFSVSDHQMALSRRECAGAYPTQSAVAIAVALPEGVVAVRGPDNRPLWQQKLDAPVAGMWRLQGGVLQHMDVLWEAARALSPGSAPDALAGPSLYLGVHDTQLYIQESQLYAKKLETSVSPKSLPWKLKQTRPLLTDEGTALSLQDADPNTLTAVALHGSAAAKENSGFFLYLQDTCDQAIQVEEETEEILPNNSDFDATDFNHVHIHVYSLWFWWKEVLVIAVSSALVMNLMIWPRFFPTKPPPTTPLPINQEYIVVERHYERPVPVVNNNTEYLGRFDTDFEPLTCLGKGGFGVVFEARNKIDHCLYAVKRITLPRTESKRKRVLREVHALATLEHEHIVRYFNSWIEEPPPTWQENWDKHWMQKLGDISELPDDYASPTRQSSRNASVMLNLHKDIDPCMDVLEYDKKRTRSLSCNDSFVIEFDEKVSKIASQTIDSTKSPIDATPPNILSKHMASGDNDDSSIVFQKTTDEHTKDFSNKILDKVKDSDSSVKSDSKKSSKKKGHKRHWSLDMCLPGTSSKMYLYIQMQLCQSDSLHDWLRKNHRWEMRRTQVKTLFSQIVSAVEYVHKQGLIHRDLKPSNIFFAQDGRVKVGDFGLVTAMADNLQDESDSNTRTRHTSRVGTHLYMSPEQLEGRAYNYKVDIYSLGMVLFELLCPFGTDSERVASLTRLRAGAFPTQFPETHPDETEVLKLMLNSDPDKRPTATGVKARAPLYEKTAKKTLSTQQLAINIVNNDYTQNIHTYGITKNDQNEKDN